MTDVVSDPGEFSKANAKADREYLESLTPEKAARALERLLECGAELEKSGGRADPPLPTCWPALLIGRDEEDEADVTDADGS